MHGAFIDASVRFFVNINFLAKFQDLVLDVNLQMLNENEPVPALWHARTDSPVWCAVTSRFTVLSNPENANGRARIQLNFCGASCTSLLLAFYETLDSKTIGAFFCGLRGYQTERVY